MTSFSPIRFGPSCGGTKITIRGCSLGCSADDFLEFTICSIDHLEVLEYHSPAKIVCLTQPWTGKKPNPGSIVLMTKSGGRGVSTLQFEFEGNPFTAKSKNSSTQGKISQSTAVEKYFYVNYGFLNELNSVNFFVLFHQR